MKRWLILKETILNEKYIFNIIDDFINTVNEAKDRNFKKWPVIGKWVWPNPIPVQCSYYDEIKQMKQWIVNRLKWMDENIHEIKEK